MNRRVPDPITRRAFRTAAPLAAVASIATPPRRVAADAPRPAALASELSTTPAVTGALAALSRTTWFGWADVAGGFNDAARRYDLHRTGPRDRDFALRMCRAPDHQRALFLRGQPRRPTPARRRV